MFLSIEGEVTECEVSENEIENTDTIVTSPLKNHTSVYNPKLSIIKNKAAKRDELMELLSLNNYAGIELGDSMLALAASTVPQCGFLGLATIILFVVGLFLIIVIWSL